HHAGGIARLRALHHAGRAHRWPAAQRHGGAGDERDRPGGRRDRPSGAHRRPHRHLPRLGAADPLTVPSSWVDAILAAGAVPASYVPDASAGRTDLEGFTGADGVEDDELRTYCVADARPLAPGAVAFLDGIEQWRAVGYGGGPGLVVDGVLSDSAALSAHRRAIGVIKSHGAQYFEGAELERALTLPAGHRTSVFQPRSRGARRAIYSWYLRLWPWEGNDLLYGLLRVEARADAATLARAAAVSAWLLRERAPVSTPDARWDRLLYPIHDVETYLRSRTPRDVIAPRG